MSRTARTTRTALAAALAAGLLLTACGGSEAPAAATSTSTAVGAPAEGPHSAVDVTFASQMLPHHTQAVAMADLALVPAPGGATDPEVRDLAARIRAAQGPEVATMTGWLAGWGAPAPDTSGGAGMAGMEGMMSDAEMASLGAATGADFDRTWVSLMLAHHRGAVAMAEVEQRDGQNPSARALAGSIIAGQSAEIDELIRLASRL